ncbi:uncharacterized protein MYCFIDRAFT_129631 [Pseudocercospora fijiensis CIRAD86]|uniref:Inclusion body clearance protein IML2 n=1 Tax=Pseudocercospora fijiensis (strain CIRAD86) TaxID=383855 RepID=N1Q606_PSEFD|nr:uncharacterized protein MYCFIDRAFT_129631 [Pseudocercospora fijiensis CIRAD86]EME87570.1 hypothetical protein MYCFIDRAFT_129631 [Pseudocercospora fijiensis CIRAD86]
MKRVGAWLHPSKASIHQSRSLTALDESAALQEAMRQAAYIVNDEVDKAEAELAKGNSPFHKLGSATTLFLRATLGFEKEMMEQAGVRLADAQDSASEYHRRALRDASTAHQSAIYPRGSEYALCHAESQLMSAVVGVLNESLSESLRGFYNLRKAFTTLQEIVDAENKYLEKHFSSSTTSLTSGTRSDTSTAPGKNASETNSGVLTPVDAKDADDDELEFVDAEESVSDQVTPRVYKGNLDGKPEQIATDAPSAAEKAEDQLDFASVSSDPIDIFIHSGAAMCFGLLQLLLSMVPPAFGKILSIFSFRGDRENGLRLLWRATAFKHNINGAMAGLVLLPFHNAAIALCDIHRREAYPTERLRQLLHEMRSIYPNSLLWLLEEARMHGAERDLETAIEVLKGDSKPTTLKQVEALRVFETSMACMFLHRYEECAQSFIRCIDLNNWSHGLYYYISGACYVELYRQYQHTDPTVAEQHKKKATELLHHVSANVGKKRFMARQLPLDVFIMRKIAKWEHRAQSRHCDFIDAIGVSPHEEMIYFWSGLKRMRPEHIAVSLASLEWSESQPTWKDEAADEKAILSLLKATCLRNLGKVAEAQTELKEHVLCHPVSAITACDHADNWPLPVAHYEKAICLWDQAGGQDGDRTSLKQCSDELAVVERWGSFDLDARIGLKLTTARETLRRIGISQ